MGSTSPETPERVSGPTGGVQGEQSDGCTRSSGRVGVATTGTAHIPAYVCVPSGFQKAPLSCLKTTRFKTTSRVKSSGLT